MSVSISRMLTESWFKFAGGRIETLVALVFGVVGLMALLYSIARLRGRGGQLVEFYVFSVVLLLAAIGVVFAQDGLLLFVFWELATVAVWRLVVYFRQGESVSAGIWTFYLNFAAAAVMLVGLILLQFETGSWELGALKGNTVTLFPALLILLGILAKSATLPLYIWLPRAYRQAPVSVCALLSGVAENLGLVLFLKLFVLTVRVSEVFYVISAILAVASSLVAGGVALNARTIRDTLAYSTVSQLGFVLLGLAVAGYSAGTAIAYGVTGGLLYITAHAIAKAGLFFAAGVVEDVRGTGELNSLGGFAHTSPTLAAAAAVLALSVMGIPPTLGFFAKLGVVIAAVQKNILLGVGALVAALFTMLYISRLYARIFLGLGDEQRYTAGSAGTAFATGLVVVMALLTVLLGIMWFVPVRFLQGDATILSGVSSPALLAHKLLSLSSFRGGM